MTRPVVFLTTLLGALFSVAPPTTSQIPDPIPTPIAKVGLRVEIRDVARLPDTRKLRAAAEDTAPAAWARVANILDGSVKDEFTYPVAMYDHGEGVAITGGFVYGGRVPALRGKFVFGDINRGRVFAADVAALKAADDGVPRTVAPIEEIELLVRQPDGTTVGMTFKELVEKTMGGPLGRADLHIHRAANGELFLSSRQDGWIRTLAAADPPARPSAQR